MHGLLMLDQRRWFAVTLFLLMVCCGCRSWSPWSSIAEDDSRNEPPPETYLASSIDASTGPAAAGPATYPTQSQFASAPALSAGLLGAVRPMSAGRACGPGGGSLGPPFAPLHQVDSVALAAYTPDQLPGVSLSTVAGFGSAHASEPRESSVASKGGGHSGGC